jgi:pSer/pThr/pTyr-binding forkhead associated (FHA) protein
MNYQIYFQNGQVFTINGFSLLGRNPDVRIMNTAQLLILEDMTKTVSKTHAALAINQYGQLMIEDLDSTNGTFISNQLSPNEVQVYNSQPQVLNPGDRVRVGEVYFGVRVL